MLVRAEVVDHRVCDLDVEYIVFCALTAPDVDAIHFLSDVPLNSLDAPAEPLPEIKSGVITRNRCVGNDATSMVKIQVNGLDQSSIMHNEIHAKACWTTPQSCINRYPVHQGRGSNPFQPISA